MIDTSGAPLHKRGYRTESNEAPIRETLAAAMVRMSRPQRERPPCRPLLRLGYDRHRGRHARRRRRARPAQDVCR